MRITISSIGQKMPDWVNMACDEYLKRLPSEIKPVLKELPLARRGKTHNIQKVIQEESRGLLSSCAEHCKIIALDVCGKMLSTEDFAKNLEQWMLNRKDVVFLIGGPDGLSEECLKRADMKLSLSRLTYPHVMVRVILLEQLYRASCILKNHPYHRA